MSKLREMSGNGRLQALFRGICEIVQEETESRVSAFNAVLEDEIGHCVVSISKLQDEEEREEKGE